MVQYQVNVLGTNGPRKMVVGVPCVDPETQALSEWRPANANKSMMNQCAATLPLSLVSTCVMFAGAEPSGARQTRTRA